MLQVIILLGYRIFFKDIDFKIFALCIFFSVNVSKYIYTFLCFVLEILDFYEKKKKTQYRQREQHAQRLRGRGGVQLGMRDGGGRRCWVSVQGVRLHVAGGGQAGTGM